MRWFVSYPAVSGTLQLRDGSCAFTRAHVSPPLSSSIDVQTESHITDVFTQYFTHYLALYVAGLVELHVPLLWVPFGSVPLKTE